MDFQGAMAPDATTTIKVAAPLVESEEPFTEEKVQTLKMVDLKLELQWRALEKMVEGMCFAIKFWKQW